MTKDQGEVWKCNVCGNVVELMVVGGGDLVCCGQPMELMAEKAEDAGNEKHVPVIERDGDTVTVTVGDIPHPMEEEHHIQWVEIDADGMIMRKFLKAGQEPKAQFVIKAESISAREYCNLHGLWKSK